MGFKKYSTSPLELIKGDQQPDWIKEADEQEEKDKAQESKSENEVDSE